ncbi:hypothetical protein E1293_16020 [Actinomadura darangshiensis]|uniref:HEAT repeat domain-containing protein n=1 Tax=Actinomadura darangshiensis TaxID=705336 RepID=A0A4R5B9V2_9ACTN|nr:HEAT repeat domain-containing protein [Actinomadura darangshiensis]TDD82801.1 hypothetical protein E1293_16020 [Actinomadura darangshiensis]
MGAGHQVAFFERELGSADPSRRAAAVKGLSRLPGHAGELAALAADTSPQVRAAVALGLGRQGEAAPVAPLVALCSDSDAEVRRRAVNALDRLGAAGPDVCAAFVRLAGDTGLRNRAAVLAWLLRHRVPVPAVTLVPLLAATDSLLWSPARLLLRLLPEADAVLADLVRTGTGEVRRRALDMLAMPQAGVPDLGSQDDPDAREAAWRRLWNPAPRVVEALLSAVSDATEPHACRVLLGALAAHRVTGAVAPAAAWLDDPEIGPGAAEALAAAGTVEAVAALRRSAMAPGRRDERLRGTAVRCMGAAGGVPDAELLFGLLDDPADPVRFGAVAGLGAFFRRFEPSATGRLERWRAERFPGIPALPPADDPEVRELAHRSAARLTHMLERDVEHADDYHNALWNIPEVRPLLPALLENPEGRVRSTALHLAERFGDVDFAARLRLLHDAHHHVRQGAAFTFMRLAARHRLTPDEQNALRPHLEQAQNDPDHYVRTRATQTLPHLSGDR